MTGPSKQNRRRAASSRRRLIAAATAVAVCVAAPVAAASSFATAGLRAQSAGSTTVLVTISGSALELAPSTVPSGSVVFNVVNKGKIARDFRIAGKRTAIIPPGKSATLRADVVKRPYRYFSIGGGRAAPFSGFLGVLEACTNPTTSTMVAVKITLRVIKLSQTTVPCGTVTFVVTNTDREYIHDFNFSIVTAVHGDVFGPRLRPGETASTTVNIPYRGTVYYWCQETEHDELGEAGDLTVQ